MIYLLDVPNSVFLRYIRITKKRKDGDMVCQMIVYWKDDTEKPYMIDKEYTIMAKHSQYMQELPQKVL